MVVQQVETAQLLPDSVSGTLTGELVCYGRSVIAQEWPAMEDGDLGNAVNSWGIALFRTIETVEPDGAAEEAAYAKWLDQTSAPRRHGSIGCTAPRGSSRRRSGSSSSSPRR